MFKTTLHVSKTEMSFCRNVVFSASQWRSLTVKRTHENMILNPNVYQRHCWWRFNCTTFLINVIFWQMLFVFKPFSGISSSCFVRPVERNHWYFLKGKYSNCQFCARQRDLKKLWVRPRASSVRLGKDCDVLSCSEKTQTPSSSDGLWNQDSVELLLYQRQSELFGRNCEGKHRFVP